MNKITAAITAVGAYVPEFRLTNKILETMVDTNDEWITTRTGIKERRILKDKDKPTSYMAIKAAEDLLKKSGTNPEEIDLVLLGTATPDLPVASTAVYVATEIGAVNAFAYDIQAACSNFLFGMSTAARYIESGRYKKILLIGADKMSSIIDYTDRTTCIIFGVLGGTLFGTFSMEMPWSVLNPAGTTEIFVSVLAERLCIEISTVVLLCSTFSMATSKSVTS
jgi:3-oxoacyl-[acyl-carrier-protein] synthase-3